MVQNEPPLDRVKVAPLEAESVNLSGAPLGGFY